MNAVLYIRLARMFVLKFSHGNPILAVTSELIRDFFFFEYFFIESYCRAEGNAPMAAGKSAAA